ncbi:MAG: hypothetical protein ACMXX5_01230 [Candidatus Woesearchaeota archaeon]
MPGKKIKQNTDNVAKENQEQDSPELSTTERIAEGQILVRAIIEMLGAPKEHIEKTLKDYIESIKQSKNFTIIKTEISEAVEQDKNPSTEQLAPNAKLFSTFAEMEIWFKDVGKLVEFCFDSLPSSVEIIEPESFKFKASEFAGLLNDLQAKLHKLDMAFKMNNADKQAMGNTFRTIITNFISYGLKTGKQTSKDLSDITGIEESKILKMLDELAEKKVIHKKGNIYSIQ